MTEYDCVYTAVDDSTVVSKNGKEHDEESQTKAKHDTWSNQVEFLLSCVAMSVGLGNLWRFPFKAAECGGGAFVIPYLIVLLLIGKPAYFLEMAIGQFSSRGSVKVYDCAPAMRGVGVGQIISISMIATYYSSIMAIALKYFYDSFSSVLPWSYCWEGWGSCINATDGSVESLTNNVTKSSATIYYE
jgi:solute carrier family 6 (neurotransmitter transporter, glycine) member 5/9